ncbi:TSUP family transporter [Nocardiopsis sediminis]|uniref:Probable membrane transporter protein n=1 Tax=Nocardiopsis sediminis TaxID=1778267 RepID=A0ABV8FNW0_9ACTN
MPDPSFLLIAGTAVVLGAILQTGVGLGLGLVAAPVVVVVAPSLMPGALLIATAVLPMFTLTTEWRHIDWRGLAWGLPARIPGSVAGAWVVATADRAALGVVVGTMVLAAVGLSLWSGRVRITPATLMAAGAVSGLTSTATSIGGPPVALLYQHEPAQRVRGTLAGFFLFGVAISLGVLAAAGQLHAREVHAGLWLVPFVIAGFLAGRRLTRVVDAGRMRAALLAVVAVSGAALVAQSVL